MCCPAETHEAIKADSKRVESETYPIGVQDFEEFGRLILVNCKNCDSTLAIEQEAA